mgnify:CR=1 FL=1
MCFGFDLIREGKLPAEFSPLPDRWFYALEQHFLLDPGGQVIRRGVCDDCDGDGIERMREGDKMSRGDVNQQTNQSINNNPSMHCSAAKDAKEICCAAVKKARRENHTVQEEFWRTGQFLYS